MVSKIKRKNKMPENYLKADYKKDMLYIGIGLLFCLIIAIKADAYYYHETVYELRHMTPLDDANISINGTLSNGTNFTESFLTGTDGYYDTTLEDGNYTIITTHGGYVNDEYTAEITNDTERFVYLHHLSTGAASLVYTDLTLNTHEICIYDKDTQTLRDCYNTNDTISLTEGQYDLYVKTNLLDSASAPSNFLSLIAQIFPYALVFAILGGAGLFILLLIYLIARRL